MGDGRAQGVWRAADATTRHTHPTTPHTPTPPPPPHTHTSSTWSSVQAWVWTHTAWWMLPPPNSRHRGRRQAWSEAPTGARPHPTLRLPTPPPHPHLTTSSAQARPIPPPRPVPCPWRWWRSLRRRASRSTLRSRPGPRATPWTSVWGRAGGLQLEPVVEAGGGGRRRRSVRRSPRPTAAHGVRLPPNPHRTKNPQRTCQTDPPWSCALISGACGSGATPCPEGRRRAGAAASQRMP